MASVAEKFKKRQEQLKKEKKKSVAPSIKPTVPPKTFEPTPIELTETAPVPRGVSPVLPEIEREPVTAREAFVEPAKRIAVETALGAKQIATEGFPKAVSQAAAVPELVTKLTKQTLKGVNKVVDSPKIKDFVNRLQVFDDEIDEWQSSFRQVFEKENKSTGEKVGAFLGEEVVPFFLGAAVVGKLEKATKLGALINTVKSPVARSIIRGAITDLGVQPSISLAQNETPEQFAFNLTAGVAMGTIADLGLDALAKKFGKKAVQETVSEAIFEAQKVITKGAKAQEAKVAFKQVFENKFGRENIEVGLKGAGEKGEEILLTAERQAQKEKAIIDRTKDKKAKVVKELSGKKGVKITPEEFAKRANRIDILRKVPSPVKPKVVKTKQIKGVIRKATGQVKSPELKALRKKLKKQQVLSFLRQKTVDLQQAKNTVINYAKDKISKSSIEKIDLDRILTIIKNAKTKGTLVKSLDRIDDISFDILRKGLKKDIKEKVTKELVFSKLRQKSVDLQNAKKAVIQFAKENLPKDKSGKISLAKAKQVLTAINDAKTKGSLAKSLAKVERIIGSIKRTENISAIKKAVSPKELEKLPLKNREFVEKIFGKRGIKRLTDKKAADLIKAKQDFSKADVTKLGKENRKLQTETKRLEERTFNEMPDEEVDLLRKLLEREVKEGKAIAKREAEKLAKKKKVTLDRLENKSKNLDVKKVEKIPTKKLSKMSFVKSKLASALEQIQKADFSFLTPDNAFQVADGGVLGGVNHRTFKVPIDDGMNKVNTIQNGIYDDFTKIEKRLKLKKESFEKIAIHAYNVQPGGREAMISAGLPKKIIDEVKLNSKELKMYEFMRDNISGMEAFVDDVTQKVYNKRLPKIENYFPIHVDSSESLLGALEKSYKVDRISKQFIKERKGGVKGLKFDAREIFLNHIRNTSYYVGLEETTKNLFSLANSPRYGKAVGKSMQKWVTDWLQHVARKGAAGREVGAVERGIDKLGNNMGIAAFGFNLITTAKQAVAKFTSGSLLGRHALIHTGDMFASPSLYKRIDELSTQQKFRQFDDPTFQESARSKLTKLGFAPLQTFDKMISNDTWYGAYRKYLSDNNIKWDKKKFLEGEPNKDAIDFADLITRKTNGSGDVQNIASVLRKNNNAALRSFLKFQNFVLGTEFQLLRNEVFRWGWKDKKQAAQIIAFLFMSGYTEQQISNKYQQYIYGEQANEWQKQPVTTEALNIFGSKIPLVNNVMSITKYDSTGSPILDTVVNLFKTASELPDQKTDYSKTKNMINLGKSVGSISGVPGTSVGAALLKKQNIEENL